MFIRARKYIQAINANGGNTSGSAGAGSSTEIKIDVDEYERIVNNIATQTADIIESYTGYVMPDNVCRLNSVIPDYEQADHEVEDMLRLLKRELFQVVRVMRKVKDDMVTIDSTKSQEAANNIYGPENSASGAGSH